jgi:NADH-quinone oxidoreductase subunit M
MGYVVFGVAAAAALADRAARTQALDGAVLQMVSHGVVTGALFLLLGMLEDRAHTREMGAFGGLLRATPLLGWGFVLAAFASLGLPGLAHFPAEFQIFLGAFKQWPAAVAIIIAGIVVTAGLYLRAIQAAFLGSVPERWRALPDLDGRERWAIVPLLALVVGLGVAPGPLLDLIHRTVELIL